MEEVNFDSIELNKFQKIQSQLNKHETKLFCQEIESKYISKVPHWIARAYPGLSNDTNDIIFNVSRRIKHLIRNFDFDSGTINLEKYYLDFLRHECQLAIPNEENKSKNLGLDKGEFKELVILLAKGDESLIEKVYLNQFKKCLTNLIRAYSCTYEEAYESTIDALYEIRKDLLNDKIMYGNLASYFNRRAALVLFNKKRKSKIETVPLESQLDYHGITVQDEILSDQYDETIKTAILKLGSECQKIIRQFYYENIKLEEVALELNKTHVAVRRQISRCRDKMRNYISKEFYNHYLSVKG